MLENIESEVTELIYNAYFAQNSFKQLLNSENSISN